MTDNPILSALTREGVLINVSVRFWRASKKLEPGDLGLDAASLDERLISLGRKRLLPKDALAQFALIESRAHPCSAIATMAHVVEYAFKWRSPVRVISQTAAAHLDNFQISFTVDSELDLAILEIPRNALEFPAAPLSMADSTDKIAPGSSVAWCGYPNIAEGTCCLFAGHISANIATHGDYLVDGVVIHGVSGAPAFIFDGKRPVIVGVMAQYVPNRASGEALPGLGSVRNAGHLWPILRHRTRRLRVRLPQRRFPAPPIA